MSEIDGPEVPRHRKKAPRRKPWKVQVFCDGPFARRFGLSDWWTRGRYARWADAREAYDAHREKCIGRSRRYGGVRLIGPDGGIRASHAEREKTDA